MFSSPLVYVFVPRQVGFTLCVTGFLASTNVVKDIIYKNNNSLAAAFLSDSYQTIVTSLEGILSSYLPKNQLGNECKKILLRGECMFSSPLVYVFVPFGRCFFRQLSYASCIYPSHTQDEENYLPAIHVYVFFPF